MHVFPTTDTYPTKIHTEISNSTDSYEASKKMIPTR